MPIDKFDMQPGEVQDFDMLFGDYLTLMADTPASHVVDPLPTGINLLHSEIVGENIKLWISAVTAGRYKATGRMTTTGGRTKEHEILILVKDV